MTAPLPNPPARPRSHHEERLEFDEEYRTRRQRANDKYRNVKAKLRADPVFNAAEKARRAELYQERLKNDPEFRAILAEKMARYRARKKARAELVPRETKGEPRYRDRPQG